MKNADTNRIGGSALNANDEHELDAGTFKAMSPGWARLPKTNSAPSSEKPMNVLTTSPTFSKTLVDRSHLEHQHGKEQLQGNAPADGLPVDGRRLGEKMATMPKKKTTPASAWPRGHGPPG